MVDNNLPAKPPKRISNGESNGRVKVKKDKTLQVFGALCHINLFYVGKNAWGRHTVKLVIEKQPPIFLSEDDTLEISNKLEWDGFKSHGGLTTLTTLEFKKVG